LNFYSFIGLTRPVTSHIFDIILTMEQMAASLRNTKHI
jgi:hypothetical protein